MATHPSQRRDPLPMIPGMVNDPTANSQPTQMHRMTKRMEYMPFPRAKAIAKGAARSASEEMAQEAAQGAVASQAGRGIVAAVKPRPKSAVRMAVNDAAPRSWPQYPQVTNEPNPREGPVGKAFGRAGKAFVSGFEKRAGLPNENLTRNFGGPLDPNPNAPAERFAGWAGRFAGSAVRPENVAAGIIGGAVVGKAAKYAAPYAKKAARYLGGKAIDYGMAGEGMGRKAFGSLGGAVKRATGETAEKFATGGRFELASTAPKPRPGAAARIKALDTPEARIAARSKAYRTPEGEPWNTTHDKVMKGINEGNPPPWVSWRPGFPGDTPYPPMKPTPPVGGGPGYQSRMLDRGAQAIEKVKGRMGMPAQNYLDLMRSGRMPNGTPRMTSHSKVITKKPAALVPITADYRKKR